ncbi:hypothetical protein GCM10028808_43530 [Spirosoma migulaei]
MVEEQIKQQIPSFKAELLGSKILTKDQIDTSKSTIFIYVHPECDHCIHEAKELVSKAKILSSVNLILLSSSSLQDLEQFDKKFSLKKAITAIQIARLSYKDAVEKFGFNSIPSALIFNRSGHLVKRFKGEVSIDKLLKYI